MAVMTEPMGCPGECVYCPRYPAAPRSYTTASPAVVRARACDYDVKRQVTERLRVLNEMGHPADKIELIAMGGTFLALPVDYQEQFIKDCYDGMSGTESRDLADARKTNETAEHRCVGLCIETRPDWCGPDEVKRMLEFGATRVELGVQTLDDDIYRLVKRGHTVDAVVQATRLLKDHGFKVYYHWMPGLPGSNPERDVELFSRLFSDDDYKPDGVKLYPTLVVAGTELERWYQEGRYVPYSTERLVELLVQMKLLVPPYARIPRVMRDIPPQFIVAGSSDSYLRDMLHKVMAERSLKCRCTRCREYGHRLRDGWRIGEPALKRFDYEASGSREIFLSYEDENETLFGLLRLRSPFRPGFGYSGTDAAVVRELHVFGTEQPLGRREAGTAQHKGLGRSLLEEAERIVRDELGLSNMAVLSGIGAREYYRSLGYADDGFYMVKTLGSACK